MKSKKYESHKRLGGGGGGEDDRNAQCKLR